MGRWTPLILMAGGLAILLGTLLGINFPMNGNIEGRNTETPTKGRQAQVLPANINVNSTETGANGTNSGSAAQSGQNSVSQNNDTNRTVIQSAPTTTAQGNRLTGSDSTAQSPSTTQRNTSGNKAPIRALW